MPNKCRSSLSVHTDTLYINETLFTFLPLPHIHWLFCCNIFCIFNLSFTNSCEIYIMIVWQYVSMDCIPINLETAMASTEEKEKTHSEQRKSIFFVAGIRRFAGVVMLFKEYFIRPNVESLTLKPKERRWWRKRMWIFSQNTYWWK